MVISEITKLQVDVKKYAIFQFRIFQTNISDLVRRDMPSRRKIGKLSSLEGVAGERSAKSRGPIAL